MENTTDQPSLLARIRKVTDKIQGLRAKFNLPKENKGRFDTYGGALALQKAKEDRRVLQGQLDPIRLIATGISCRDCIHFADLDSPTCWRFGFANSTKHERSNAGDCGPSAELFVGHEPRGFAEWHRAKHV